jgi:hypothetical protein
MGTITDSTNQASGMSVLALSWVSACGKRAAFFARHLASREKIVFQARGLGQIAGKHPHFPKCAFFPQGLGSCVGPLLGGFLASPAELYPTVFDAAGLFGRLPFLLPCLTITGMCGVALVAVRATHCKFDVCPEPVLANDGVSVLWCCVVCCGQALVLLPPDGHPAQYCGRSTKRYTKVDRDDSDSEDGKTTVFIYLFPLVAQ